jgi:hypothetical protein
MEAYHVIAGGTLTRFSPQQLVDCASNEKWGNFGCEGGIVPFAFEYLKTYPLMTYNEYPYVSDQLQHGQCKFRDSST